MKKKSIDVWLIQWLLMCRRPRFKSSWAVYKRTYAHAVHLQWLVLGLCLHLLHHLTIQITWVSPHRNMVCAVLNRQFCQKVANLFQPNNILSKQYNFLSVYLEQTIFCSLFVINYTLFQETQRNRPVVKETCPFQMPRMAKYLDFHMKF